MNGMKRIFAAALAIVMLCSCMLMTSCRDDADDLWEYDYNPYSNKYKDDVPTGKKIKVKGNEYIFSEIMIRNKDAELQIAAQNAFEELYEYVFVEFSEEDTVSIYDYNGFFNIRDRQGVREGNVLTIQNTNSTGDYTYDIRIEIHKKKVILIHNAHSYDTPGTYATITFEIWEG